jgi:hypothetical protein
MSETPRDSGDPPPPKSRLQSWLAGNGFTSASLEVAIGMSRQGMTKIRGGADLRLSTMRRILRGARQIAKRDVQMGELFDLEP